MSKISHAGFILFPSILCGREIITLLEKEGEIDSGERKKEESWEKLEGRMGTGKMEEIVIERERVNAQFFIYSDLKVDK